jgi:hypothetical protein
MARSIRLSQWAQNNIRKGIYLPMPPEYEWPEDYRESEAVLPLRLQCPLIGADTPAVMHHSVAYPGMRWEYPFRPMFGLRPYYGKLDGDYPAGTTIGASFTIDAFGDYVPYKKALNVSIPSPEIGHISFLAYAFSQTDQVAHNFKIHCDYGFHWFTHPTGLGTGDGLSPENAASWANTFSGTSTVGPSKGKVLVFRGGRYTGPEYVTNSAFNAINLIAYPGEVAEFEFKILVSSSDTFIGSGIRMVDKIITKSGMITIDGVKNRVVLWEVDCENLTLEGDSDNQSFIFSNSIAPHYRDSLSILSCTFYNSTTHFCEIYSVDYLLVDKCEAVFTEGSKQVSRSLIFPKALNKHTHITDCVFDNPEYHVEPSAAFVDLFTSGGPLNAINVVENCYYNGNGGLAYQLNKGAGSGTVVSVNHLIRSSSRGGRVAAYGQGQTGSWSYMRDCAFQNQDGATQGLIQSSSPPIGKFTVQGNHLAAVSGLIDANGRLTNGDRGLSGKQYWKPAELKRSLLFSLFSDSGTQNPWGPTNSNPAFPVGYSLKGSPARVSQDAFRNFNPSTPGVNVILMDDTALTGTMISAEGFFSTVGSSSQGFVLANPSTGNGYQILINSTNTRIFAIANWAISGSALRTIDYSVPSNNYGVFRRNNANGDMEFWSGVSPDNLTQRGTTFNQANANTDWRAGVFVRDGGRMESLVSAYTSV